ncbi:MAG TPA: hypothetical protein ENH29_01940 [Bacteroidetes bacterium]|nr:hypothetical protein [Bacteroidota bacterium]
MKSKRLKFRFVLLCFLFTSLVATGQEKPVGQSDSTKVQKEPACTDFVFSQTALRQLGDYDLGKWSNQLPHFWVARMPQFGQPQLLQNSAVPGWMTQVIWQGISLTDPVYGVFDLNFLPVVPIDTLRVIDFTTLEINNENVTAPRPYTQVFYHTGDNGLTDVNILFRRGFSHGIKFKTGADFFKYGGIYSNSKVNIFRLHADLTIPLSERAKLTYRVLSNKQETGTPGAINKNYQIQFSRLQRKALRQDHALELSYNYSQKWRALFQVQIHRDEREYTDWKLPWHTLEKMSWANLSAAATRVTKSSTTLFRLQAEAVSASRNGFAGISEFPGKILLTHQINLGSNRFAASLKASVYSRNKRAFTTNIIWNRGISGSLNLSASGFYRQVVPPLGWRRGRVLPFENQPWPIMVQTADSTFITHAHADKTAELKGGQIKLKWHSSSRFDLYAGFLFQQVANLEYPINLTEPEIQFKTAPDYFSSSLFLSADFTFTNWLSATTRYQFTGYSQRESPDLLEIPNQHLFFNVHATHSFFQNNLKANLLIYTEYMSRRNSYGLTQDFSQFTIETLPALPLLHVKLIFEVGDADVFFYWYNLTNQSFAYRSQHTIPGWQFQFGVRWKFWN